MLKTMSKMGKSHNKNGKNGGGGGWKNGKRTCLKMKWMIKIVQTQNLSNAEVHFVDCITSDNYKAIFSENMQQPYI